MPLPIDVRLRAPQVGEQVADLLVAQVLEQALGHDRGLGRLHLLDGVARERQLLAVAAAEHDDVLVLLDDDAGQGPAVGRGDDRPGVALADLGAGIDDVQEHRLQVVAAVGRQVGPDLAPLAEEGVAAGALVDEDLPARLGNAGAGPDDARPAVRSATGARPRWTAGSCRSGA